METGIAVLPQVGVTYLIVDCDRWSATSDLIVSADSADDEGEFRPASSRVANPIEWPF
jgi:hypothetical protein